MFNAFIIIVHKIDVTVLEPYPFLVDISNNTDAEIRGYPAKYNYSATFDIGREIDTGPGDVGDEIINPPAGGIPTSNLGFPEGSRVLYYIHNTYRRMQIILGGINEKKECIGAFYITAEDGSGKLSEDNHNQNSFWR